MRKGILYIFVAIFCFWSYNAYSQINCTVPLPPVLTSVSVQYEKGITELKWTLSPDKNIAAYIVYLYSDDNGNRGDSITTLWDSTATSYKYFSTAYKYFSTSFVVAAYRSPKIPGKEGCYSPFSNPLSTIFAKASIDTCNKKIVVSWSYTPYSKKVTGYSILMSVNGGNFAEATNLGPERNSDTLKVISTDAKYCFIVRANLEDGTVSTSNKAFPLSGVCTKPPVIIPDTADIDTEPEIITVPNVLISNSLKRNNLFRPVLSFIPKDYLLIISDRRGNILFKTKDYNEAWDGSRNGNGVYLWFLKVTPPSGKSISKTGTVTIINNRE